MRIEPTHFSSPDKGSVSVASMWSSSSSSSSSVIANQKHFTNINQFDTQQSENEKLNIKLSCEFLDIYHTFLDSNAVLLHIIGDPKEHWNDEQNAQVNLMEIRKTSLLSHTFS